MFDITEQEIMKKWKGDLSKPVVSICTITYNHEKFIPEAIDSFLMQETDFPFEVVIGEDCSTDATRKVINSYVKKYPNIIKLIISEDNVGANKNFWRTVNTCQGEFIALCEGDDYWTDNKKLQIQIDEMKKYPNVNISFHPVYELNNGQKGKKLARHSNKYKIFTQSEVILGRGGFMPTNSLVFKKKVVDLLPNWFYKDAPVGDYYLQIFGSLNGGALYINRIMSIYRRDVMNSWSDKQRSILNIEKHFSKTKLCLEAFDKQFDNQYTDEIRIVKNFYIYNLAISYLRIKDFKNLNFLLSKYKFTKLNFKCKLLYILNFFINIKLRIKK